MNNKNIKHIFFDLDHTLWDFDKNSALTFEKIFKLNELEIPHSEFIKVYEPINLAYWRLYRHNKIDKESLRYKRLKDCFDALHIEVEDAVINQLSEDYITYLSTYNHLFPNAISVLDYLAENYTLHIITNGFHEVQEKKMRNANILKYFKTVTDSESTGLKKPNPIIFEFALKQAKALKTESIMIGDSLEADVFGAINFGMQAIWYNYSSKPFEENIIQVKTLTELKSYF